MGRRVRLDSCGDEENLLLPPKFKPRNFQSAASRCIDFVSLARSSIIGPVSIINIYSHLNLLKPTGYVMHHQFNIQQLYALPTLYLFALNLSQNKQRICPI